MPRDDSIFGADLDGLKRLLTVGDDASEPEASSNGSPVAPIGDLTEKLGLRIGRYRLLRTLGEGGMGMVYLAQQNEPIKRRVALKIIKPGMDSRRVVARFEAERQTLALLDHPHIAHVHDAGTTDQGRPYFVMEYVTGLPITEYCDRHRLSIEDRLCLFQQVCHAVQHAHQKGIIHRDLKPSNILVSAEGDQAIPKIIDFGVAKAMSHSFTELTLFTIDSQLLGTPEYMSPEQADMASEDIDTRSDIYSLGVLLYVLLTGTLPYDAGTLRAGGLEHIRKVIRETDPKTPSTRLTRLGNEGQAIAEKRCTQIHVLAKHLRKELEWIPLKAMRKERSERYRSASEFADDIENYRKGEPLIAGPPGTVYRLRKFVRRNRVLMMAAVAVLSVLLAGVVVSTVLAIGQARVRAEAQLIADFLETDVLGSASKARVGEATVSYILDAASKRLDEGRFKEKPLIEASIRQRLAGTYRSIGESDQAEQHFLKAILIYQQRHSEEHPDTLRVMGALGYIYEDQGRYRDMERLSAKMVQIQQSVYGVEHPVGAINVLGVALCHLGKYEEAESWFNRALHSEWPYIKLNLARVYAAKGRYEEAEQLLRKTIEAARWDVEYGVDIRYSTELANLYREWGNYDKAEPLFDKTLKALRQIKGDEHFLTILCMYGLVQLYVDQGRHQEAEGLFSEALPIARRRLREDHPVTQRLVNTRAVLHQKQKQYDEAKKLFDEALQGRQRELGEDHPDTLESRNDLGVLYKALEQYVDAEEQLLEAVAGRRLKLGDTHAHTLASRNELVELYEAWNKPDEALKWKERLPDIIGQAPASTHAEEL